MSGTGDEIRNIQGLDKDVKTAIADIVDHMPGGGTAKLMKSAEIMRDVHTLSDGKATKEQLDFAKKDLSEKLMNIVTNTNDKYIHPDDYTKDLATITGLPEDKMKDLLTKMKTGQKMEMDNSGDALHPIEAAVGAVFGMGKDAAKIVADEKNAITTGQKMYADAKNVTMEDMQKHISETFSKTTPVVAQVTGKDSHTK